MYRKQFFLILLLTFLLPGMMHAQSRKKKRIAGSPPTRMYPDYIRQNLVNVFTLRNFTYEIWTGIKDTVFSKKETFPLEETVDVEWYLVYLTGKGKSRQLTRYFCKLATDPKGKIAGTADYRIDGDSLLIGCNTYGGHFESRLVLVYTPDKYGWLTERNNRWEPLHADTLSDAYRKPYPVYAPLMSPPGGR